MGQNEVLDDLVSDAERDFMAIRRNLMQAATRLAEDLARLVQTVEDGLHVNDLGEIQARGPQVDILCARYEDAAQNLMRLRYVAAKLNKDES